MPVRNEVDAKKLNLKEEWIVGWVFRDLFTRLHNRLCFRANTRQASTSVDIVKMITRIYL